MTTCTHPKRERRVRRVSMPEGVYRTEWCQRCRVEFGDVFEARHESGGGRMSRLDRFLDFALEHPWKVLAGFWALYLGVGAVFLVAGIPSFAIGWLVGASWGAIRVLWQAFVIARDNKRWNEYLAGRGTYR